MNETLSSARYFFLSPPSLLGCRMRRSTVSWTRKGQGPVALWIRSAVVWVRIRRAEQEAGLAMLGVAGGRRGLLHLCRVGRPLRRRQTGREEHMTLSRQWKTLSIRVLLEELLQPLLPRLRLVFSRHSSDEDSCREEEMLLQQQNNVKSTSCISRDIAGRS